MINILFKTILSIGLITTFAYANKSTQQDNLLKVTSDNKAKCIVYYLQKNELYCSTDDSKKLTFDPAIIKKEKFNIVFDDRVWQIAWAQDQEGFITIEYLPKGDDINHWHELITSQFFPGLQTKRTPKELAQAVINQLLNAGYKPQIHYFLDTPQKVIFEFQITSPANQQQDELQMITSHDHDIYALHYVMAQGDMGSTNREKWLNNLKHSTIK